MRRYIGFGMMLVLLLSLCGCKGALDDAKKSTIYIQSSGDVFEAVVEDFDTKVFDKEDLEKEVNKEIKAYNSEEERIKLTEFEVKEDVAKAWLSYAQLKDYNDFNKMEFELSDFADAEVSETLYQVSYESEISFSKIKADKDKKLKVLLVPEEVDVKVDGTILYTTKDVTVNSEKNTATTVKGDNYIIYEEQ